METVDDVVKESLNHLVREQRTALSTLAVPVDNTASTIEVASPFDLLRTGDLVGVGYEIMYVVSADAPTRTMEVLRGQHGTIPTAHDAGDLVYLDARFFPGEAFNQVKSELLSASETLFSVSTVEVHVNQGDWMAPVDLTHLPLVKRVLVARRAVHSGKLWLDVPCRLIRQAPTGYGDTALRFDRPNPGGPHQIVVAHGFKTDSLTPATLLNDVGLLPYMRPAIPFGVAYRLLGPRDTQTSDRSAQGQGVSRDPNEMHPLASVRTAEWLRAQRDIELSRALTQLLAEWSWSS